MPNQELRQLDRLRSSFGPEPAAQRLRLLRRLERARMAGPREIEQLHEALCWSAAYPDDDAVLQQVRRMLARFGERADLRRHAARLTDSGIAGTALEYPFYAATAARLARRWPDRLRIDWERFEHGDTLESLLQLLVLWSETPGIDEFGFEVREWIDRLRGTASDGAFVVQRMLAAHRDPFVFERAYEALDLPLRLEPGEDTPSRTAAAAPVDRVAFQTAPLRGARPVLAEVVRARPLAIRELSRSEGRRYVELARDAMVTRSRDLDVFAYGDPDDVRVVDWEDGLQFAAIGMRPERRLLLEAVYGFLTLKNGVPIGYVLNSALSGSAEIAYNVFETFRGGEASHVYGRVLATVHALFGTDSFTIYPYQLGEDNDEALQSGAWWFYQKLGFRARDPEVLRTMEQELARMRKRPAHRSSIATLRRLAGANVYWHAEQQRDDVIGLLPLGQVGLAVTTMVAARYGADRERAESGCLAAARRLLGVKGRAGWSSGEWLWLSRWAPLIAVLPGVEDWSKGELAALRDVVRHKGGRRESEFVRSFDAHPKLRAALQQLMGAGARRRR